KAEGESLWDKLDHYYRIVKSTLLLHQSPTTGLFPTKTHGDNHKAKVHDNLYCAACSWALALAYRRIDDDKGRTHELEHSAIKCMRGILYCYMRQADKVKYCSVDRIIYLCYNTVTIYICIYSACNALVNI
uniref:Phosphorylase b kinase regulatory subunit n=1 Tax=Meleagris gallopavo TaxID=9103 RepID=A0A803XZR0_MELGA